MLDKLASLPDETFLRLWNASASLDEAAARIRVIVGRPCPRWAVMARAAALRREGVGVKPLPGPAKVGR